jgi:hypothetical protein
MVRLSHGRIGTCTKTSCVPVQFQWFHDLLLQSDVLPKKGFPIVFHGIKGRELRKRSTLRRISTSMKHRLSVTIV